MDSHQMAEPEGLWQNLESQISDLQTPRRQSHKPALLWLRRCGVAAAIAILAAVGYKALHTTDIDISSAIPDDIMAKAPSANTPSSQAAAIADEPHAAARVHTAMLLARAASQRSITTSATNKQTSTKAESEAAATTGNAEEKAAAQPSLNEETASQTTPPRHYGSTSDYGDNDYTLFAENKRSSYNHRHMVGLSLSASGLQLAQNNNGLANRVLSGGMAYENKYFAVNSAASAHSNIPLHHKMPVNVSLKAKFGIANRFFAEGGLSYSLLRSDGEDMSASVDQSLHYLGIPVNFGFMVWQNKRIRIYTYAGGEMQKLVSGKLKSTYKVDAPLTESTNLSEKKLQWSIGAGAGIDVGILPTLSIFAEPGVKHYFDNGSQIDNIYKEKPTNFNLQLGLRFDL